ncbi:MAG: flagellar filament capping protein FliD, partial [Thermodesulfobacteriota bacterium]|nr:flagellar filament capping protein FliD [Thermodesulfobacteriota bacterium]
ISDQTKYDADTGEAAIMIGNYSFQIVAQRIKDLLTDSVPGLIDGTDPYVHLAQIGINSDPDDNGRWTINYSTLNSAMSTDLNAVSRLFVEDEASGTDGVLALLSQELEDLNDTETGAMNALIDSYEGIISNIDVKLEREARRIDLVEKRLTRQFAALEVLLGQLSGQSTYLESLIDQLPKIGSSSKQ